MKRLYLMRHAKSSWAEEELSDQERPLAPRGRRAAKRLARHLREEAIAPEVVLCSSALRTRQTLELIEPGLGEPREMLVEDELYGAGADQLLQRLRRLTPEVRSVLLIGHNPGVQDLAVLLARGGKSRDQLRAHFPTAALATLTIAESGWSTLAAAGADLIGYVTPRDLG